MSSNNYWEVGPLGEGRSFGLALADSGGAVTGGGGDRKDKVLERVRRDARVIHHGDLEDTSVRGIKRSLKLITGSECEREKQGEGESKSEEEKVEEEKVEEENALLDIPVSLPEKLKAIFPTVAEEQRKLDLARWKTRWEAH